MIDDSVILFSTIMCLVVIVRAIRLDSVLPWFGRGRPARFDAWRQEAPPAPGPDDVP